MPWKIFFFNFSSDFKFLFRFFSGQTMRFQFFRVVIKADIEGAELKIIPDMVKTLSNNNHENYINQNW